MNRRDLAVLAAVAALVVAGIVATRREPAPRPEVAASPAPAVTASPARDTAPFPGQENQLPRLATALPQEIAIDTAKAVRLSADPADRALALFEAGFDTGSQKNRLANQVYVLGDDAKLRLLDVVSLTPTFDAYDNPRSPFATTALKPDGTQAAFPQRDRVTVVDLTTAVARQLRVPGNNQRVLWQGEQLLVAQTESTVQVDPLSGRVTPRPYAGFGLVAGLSQGAPVLDVVNNGRGWLVRTWSDSSPTSAARVADLPVDADARQPAWAHQWQVALDYRSFDGQPALGSTDRRETVVAIDSNSGTTVGKLVLSADEPAGRPPGCCAVLGWLNQHAVLLDMPGAGRWILAWDPVTGQVFRIARITFRGARLALSLVDGAYL